MRLEASVRRLLFDIEGELIRWAYRDGPERHVLRLLDHGPLHLTHPKPVVGEVDQVVERLTSLILEYAKRSGELRDSVSDQCRVGEKQTTLAIVTRALLEAGSPSTAAEEFSHRDLKRWARRGIVACREP